MLKFDKDFLFVEWNDILKDKDVLVADCIPDFKARFRLKNVEFVRAVDSESEFFPFLVKEPRQTRRFCYYDPHLKYKLAMERNEVVYWRENGAQPWRKVMSGHKWSVFLDYMVADKELLTHRQLARWLARGNGEQIVLNDVDALDELISGDEWIYAVKDADKPVPDTVRVRRWEDDDWFKPTLDYCEGVGE